MKAVPKTYVTVLVSYVSMHTYLILLGFFIDSKINGKLSSRL